MSGGLVPLKTNATPAGTLFGAGGGGGAGPNPVVSTLTFSAGSLGSGNTNGTINMTTILNILDPAISTPQNFHFQYATNQDPVADAYPPYVAQYQSSFNLFQMFGPSSDITTTGNFSFSTDILGRSQIAAANATGGLSTLVVSADSVLVPTGMSVSSLSVSSINGAQPGSAVIPADIFVSSINVNSQGYIQMFQDNTNSSGRIIGYGDVNNASSLSLAVGFVAGYASKINGTDGLWCVENDATGANQAYGDFGAGRFAVLGNNAGASKSVPVLDSDGAGNLDINAVGAVNISTTSFTVNGAPVGGGSAPFFSTLNQTPSTINCDANTTQILLSFSTTAGHLYQIQTQMTIQGNGGQEGTANDDVIQEVLNEIYLNTTQGSFISTANAAARDVGIGTCGMWRSNLTGTSLAISGTFSTTVQLGDVYLTDFGPV